ncbi:MAG: hypothetical protein IJT04_09785 [Bacteroidales bacterium]|nr:hypothetical protein [Bacteroidales bacterium]
MGLGQVASTSSATDIKTISIAAVMFFPKRTPARATAQENALPPASYVAGGKASDYLLRLFVSFFLFLLSN